VLPPGRTGVPQPGPPDDPYRFVVHTRRVLLATGSFIVTLALLLARWLLPGPVGAADNGDGWRLLCRVGANDLERLAEDWVQMSYPASPPCDSGYRSSQTWLHQAAQWLGHLLGDDAALDLYVLGAMTCVLVALATTLLAFALPLPDTGRVVAAGVLLLLVADSAFFGWFVSVLSEGAVFLGVIVTVAGLLVLQREDRWRFAGAAITGVGAVVAVNAKVQTVVLLAPLALALLLSRKTGRSFLVRWALPTVVLAVVAAATVGMHRSGDPVGREYAQVNAYNSIFSSIVREETADEDLAAFGLPPEWARYVGTNWWMQGEAAYLDPLWPEYKDQVTRRAVATYYVEHPGRTLLILHEGAQDVLTARPDYIGSYPPDSGQPAKAQEFRVPLLSGATRLLAPLGYYALLPLWALIAVAATSSWRRARPVAVATVFALSAAVSQHVVSALGEGIEGVKHGLGALFCTLLAAVLASVCLVVRRNARRSASAGEDPPAPPAAVPTGVSADRS
jgi:hypothetical protein